MAWKTIKKNGNNTEIKTFSDKAQHTFTLDPSKNWVDPRSYVGLLGFNFYKKQHIDTVASIDRDTNEVSVVCRSSDYTSVAMSSSFEQTLHQCTSYVVNFRTVSRTATDVEFEGGPTGGSSIKISVYENTYLVATEEYEIKKTYQELRRDDDFIIYFFNFSLYRDISKTPSDINFKVVFSFHESFGRFYIEKEITSGSYRTGDINEITPLDHIVFTLGE